MQGVNLATGQGKQCGQPIKKGPNKGQPCPREGYLSGRCPYHVPKVYALPPVGECANGCGGTRDGWHRFCGRCRRAGHRVVPRSAHGESPGDTP